MIHSNENGVNIFTFVNQLFPELSADLVEITDNESFFNSDVEMTENELYQYVDIINSKVESGNIILLPLAIALNNCFRVKNEQYEKMSELKKITFDHLQKIFKINEEFVAICEEGELVGSRVHDAKIIPTNDSKLFVVTGMFTFSNGNTFYQIHKEFYIPYFTGMKYIDTLNVRPMQPEEKKMLTERGKIFLKYALKPNYVSYTGTMFIRTSYGCIHYNSTGRIMVDHIGANKNKPDYKNKNNTFKEIPEDLLYLTWPFFDAFSFKTKKWGQAFVKNVKEIKFDDNAFDALVLNNTKKKLIKALVLNSDQGFTDIITDKSGGCIFLLHGPPGTGKTLTAESIAELLHRPLYSITVGELGTTANQLESQLTSILEITHNWNSVLLLDECDLFLERRTDDNMSIERNAMVGIFLRLLERHVGVMFMTTNRANCIDTAFESRISIIVKYNSLSLESRVKVWKNLLSFAKIDSLSNNDIDALSKIEINGRQIKNSIRMSQALAKDNNENLNVSHFNIVIDHIKF